MLACRSGTAAEVELLRQQVQDKEAAILELEAYIAKVVNEGVANDTTLRVGRGCGQGEMSIPG